MTVKLATDTGSEKCDFAFAREIREKSGARLERCYQCVACSAGCPAAYEMDYPPHQLIRMTQMGLKDTVLESKTMWLCLSCETCATRCPNDIDIVRLFDTLRVTTLGEGRGKSTHIPLFHATFLNVVRKYGKVHELSLILSYTFASGNIFKVKALLKDALMGARMFVRGKLLLLPDKIKRIPEIKKIYQQTTGGKQA